MTLLFVIVWLLWHTQPLTSDATCMSNQACDVVSNYGGLSGWGLVLIIVIALDLAAAHRN